MIIGGAGSGKSTAARKIGGALGLPVYHMDREVYWLSGWRERPNADRLTRVEQIVARDAWVFEGSFSSTFHLREARADTLIWLATPLSVRVARVIRRNIRHRGQARGDLAPGCVEEIGNLPGFLWFILSTHRRSKARATALFRASALPKHRFTTAAQVNAYVDTLTGAPP